MLDYSALARSDMLFSWTDSDAKIARHWATTRMNRWLATRPREARKFMVRVDPDFVEYCRTNRGIEPHRLERITLRDLKKYPIIFTDMPDGSQLLLDGHHRYVRAKELGQEYVRAFLLTEEQAGRFEVTGFPSIPEGLDLSQVLRRMYSGID